jgi:hypothetical protein
MAAVALGSMASRYPHWGDALEFTAAARVLGVPHPTGYPLQMLVAKVAAEVPVSSLARRMNLLSAGWMSLAAALLASCVWRLTPPESRRFGSRAWFLAVAAPGCAFFGPTGLELGSTAEIYAFHLAFQGALLRVALELGARLAEGSSVAAGRLWPSAGRLIALGALLAGLSLTHHRLALFSAAGFILVAFWFLAKTSAGTQKAFRRKPSSSPLQGAQGSSRGRGVSPQPSDQKTSRRIFDGRRFAKRTLLPLGMLVIGLTPIFVLPIRAAGNPWLNWGAPDTLERLLWVLRGGEFVQGRFLQWWPGAPVDWQNPEELKIYFVARTGLVRDWSARQLVPETFHETSALGAAGVLLAIFAAAGAVIVRRRSPAGLWAAGIALGGPLATAYLYNIPDPEGYLLAAWMALWLLAGAGASAILGKAERFLAGREVRFVWAVVLVVPLALWRLNAAEPYLAMIEDELPADVIARAQALPELYAYRTLDALPLNAVLITSGDNDIYAMWFAQFGSRHRLDVLPVGANFLKEEWAARLWYIHPAALQTPILGGGGTPSGPFAYQEFVNRVADRVIQPALAEKRPVFFWIENDVILGALEKRFAIVPAGDVLLPEELQAVRRLYGGRILARLYRVPGGSPL